jgi:hypothetical protein
LFSSSTMSPFTFQGLEPQTLAAGASSQSRQDACRCSQMPPHQPPLQPACAPWACMCQCCFCVGADAHVDFSYGLSGRAELCVSCALQVGTELSAVSWAWKLNVNCGTA